jgi:hypothetical protein
MKPKEYYLHLRRQYEPTPVKLVIIAESPPISGLYVYDAKGKTTEPLFLALMKQLSFSPNSKKDGLKELQKKGWILVDATYEQVDKHSDSERNQAIEQGYKELRGDLERLVPDKSAPLILIKKNVCQTLELKLVKDGFDVLNNGRSVYFPAMAARFNFISSSARSLNRQKQLRVEPSRFRFHHADHAARTKRSNP